MPGQSDPLFSLGYWIVSHKATLKTWWGMSLLAIMLVGGVWVAVFFGMFFSQESKIDQQLHTTLTRLTSWVPSRIGSPSVLTVSEPVLLDRGSQRTDVVVMLTNPNAAWAVTDVVISCVSSDQTLVFSPVTLAANATRAVMLLGQKTSVTTSLTCTIKSQSWHRSVAALFPQPAFSVITSAVHATTVTVQGRIVPSVTIDATLRNDSGDNLANVDVPIVVRNGATTVAVDEITIGRWATREVKHVADTWTGTDGGADGVDIFPQVNIFSTDSRF